MPLNSENIDEELAAQGLREVADFVRLSNDGSGTFTYTVPIDIATQDIERSKSFWIRFIQRILEEQLYEVKFVTMGLEEELYRDGVLSSMQVADRPIHVMVFRCQMYD